MNISIKKILSGAVLAWFVVTYSGERVAGPFTLLQDCSELAKIMAKRYYNVSQICQSF